MTLATSDTLAQQVLDADILVLSVLTYNFNFPGAMNAWIEKIARPGLTFRSDLVHTHVGLAAGKTAYIVVATDQNLWAERWISHRRTCATCWVFLGSRICM